MLTTSLFCITSELLSNTVDNTHLHLNLTTFSSVIISLETSAHYPQSVSSFGLYYYKASAPFSLVFFHIRLLHLCAARTDFRILLCCPRPGHITPSCQSVANPMHLPLPGCYVMFDIYIRHFRYTSSCMICLHKNS